jgi:hypothetical protein
LSAYEEDWIEQFMSRRASESTAPTSVFGELSHRESGRSFATWLGLLTFWMYPTPFSAPNGLLAQKAAREVSSRQMEERLPSGAVARLGPKGGADKGDSAAVVAVSRAGDLVAWTGRGRSEVYVWDRRSQREFFRIDGFDGAVTALSFSHDGKLLGTGTLKGTVRLWDVQQSHKKGIGTLATGALFKHPPGLVKCIAFSPDGRSVAASGYYDEIVEEWDVSSSRERQRWSGGGGDAAWWIAFSPNGELLAACFLSRGIRLWSDTNGSQVSRLYGHSGGVLQLAFAKSGGTLASCSNDGTVRLWDIRAGRELWRIEVPKAVFASISFSSDDRMIASSEQTSGEICLWETLTHKPRLRFRVRPGTAGQVAFFPRGLELASAQTDGTVVIWDASGERIYGRRSANRLSHRNLERLWAELSGSDAERAYRAICALAEGNREALAFLESRVHPVVPVGLDVVRKLVEQLDSRSFKDRENAAAELQKLGEAAEPSLRTALRTANSTEVRVSVERLLQRIDALRRNPDGVDLAQRRAVEALERMGTSEALSFLRRLAGGLAASPLSGDARAAIARLRPQDGGVTGNR